jgi:hypothetical protein
MPTRLSRRISGGGTVRGWRDTNGSKSFNKVGIFRQTSFQDPTCTAGSLFGK